MWKNLSQVSASATTDHTQTSTIVCVTQVRANKLTNEDWSETNISLSSSNYANTMT